MRTNPFFDAWLFLIGATDDHRALGIFQYVMVALFLALLFASVWIAFKTWSENSEQRRASRAIVVRSKKCRATASTCCRTAGPITSST